MKCISTIIVAVMALSSGLAANTYWVDKDNPNASDSNPGTQALPFRTINAAANNPNIAANDTINVMPGVYDEGGQPDPQSGITNRVYLPVKIVLHAVQGKSNTVIVGARDPNSADTHGRGPGSIRCIYVTAADTRIEGFTIKDGTTNMDNEDAYRCQGGGVLAKDGSAGVYVLDCTITGCSASKGGGLRGCTALRCLVKGNWSSSSGSAGNGSLFACSVVDSNRGGAALSSCKTTNCTIINNNGGGSVGWSRHYNSVFAGNGSSEFDSKVEHFDGSTCTASNGVYQVIAPGFEDYRLVEGTDAVGMGDAEYFNRYIGLGPGWFTTDFTGAPLPSSGKINAGAVQSVATPAGGAIQVKTSNARDLVIDGKTVPYGSWVFPEVYPTQWNVRAIANAGEYIYSFGRDGIGRAHPMMDDSVWLMPSPNRSDVTVTYPNFATRAYWVNPDPAVGSDDNPGTEASPFATLQKAIDTLGTGVNGIVFAAAGDYNIGSRSLNEASGDNSCLANRVCIPSGCNALIRGAGAGQSFITGAEDSTTGGNGPGAVRAVGCLSTTTVIQGFTLRECYSDAANAAFSGDQYSCVYSPTKGGVFVQDCQMTGNGGLLGVARGCCIIRTAVTNNTPERSVLDYSVMSGCLVADNVTKETNSYIGQDTALYGCTVVGCGRRVGVVANYVDAYGCILMNSSGFYNRDTVKESLCWNILSYSSLPAGNTWTQGDACFADSSNYRVRSMSLARTCAGVPTTSNYGAQYYKYALGDMDGRPVSTSVPVVGCYQDVVVSPGVYVSAENGGLSPAGYAPVAGGSSVTVTLAAGTRPCAGYVANGVTNRFEETSERVFTAADVGQDGLYLEALYTSDWYVDANAAGNSGLGFTPGSAKKTFEAIFAGGQVISGDTVHAAPGVYSDGTMLPSGRTVGSRLIVPEGVTVIADNGPAATVILGADATIEANGYGMGTNAVRCVTLNRNSKVSGFTLTGGRTGYVMAGTDAGKTDPENIGAGVLGLTEGYYATQIAENCIISNNVAHRGGGACYATLRGCLVLGNCGTDATGNASGTFRCGHYGAVVDRNIGNYAVMYPKDFVYSTVGYGNESEYSFFSNDNCAMTNSIICGTTQVSTRNVAVNTFFSSTPKRMIDGLIGAGSAICDPAELQLHADCRPVIGACRAVDVGDAAAYDFTLCGGKDAAGGQRIYNGAIDSGALEGDWRPVYAADISGNRRFTITSVDPDVIETERGSVAIGQGMNVEANWSNAGSALVTYELRFKVSGAGSLALTINDGEPVVFAASDAEQMYVFCADSALTRLRFASTGTGTGDLVELLSCVRAKGTVLSFR